MTFEVQAHDRLTRRRVLALAAGAAGSVIVTPAALAQGDELASVVTAYVQGAPVKAGRIKIAIEKLVDNGNTVPVTVTVDSPMTAADHVTGIAIFNEKNPQRDVVRIKLGPASGKAVVSTRIRLATSQKLVAVARMSDGTAWTDTVDVVVVLAACIEGDP
ncbi:MAG TPA: SoxY-related AACIE arm protein [Ramlibacter sp.]|nr:SoxY-related AACIE arm protein [Ramlibacter sp.]